MGPRLSPEQSRRINRLSGARGSGEGVAAVVSQQEPNNQPFVRRTSFGEGQEGHGPPLPVNEPVLLARTKLQGFRPTLIGWTLSARTNDGSCDRSLDAPRNITGRLNGDGTVTIFGITSTVSGSGDQGADPNKLVSITDDLGALTLPTNERFTTLETAGFGEVLGGVAFAPVPAPGSLTLLGELALPASRSCIAGAGPDRAAPARSSRGS